MMQELYSTGDWIVHKFHGVGQIKGIEEKRIGKHKNTYYHIKTHNGILWLPVDKLNEEWLRSVASDVEMRQALAVLAGQPQQMNDNLNKRKSRIKEVDSNCAPTEIAELLRDLKALKKRKTTLSQFEEQALRHLTECFLAELSVSLDIDKEQARQIFNDLFQRVRQA